MANRIQHLRGSNTEHSTYTGAKGEISLVTDTSANRVPTGELRIHDGSTAGGLPVKLGTSSKPLTDDIYLSSGTGINFSAYATSGNPSSNLLDDYEEGTWMPSIGGTATYTVGNGGTYTKIGCVVIVNAIVQISTLGTGSQTLLSGLPFIVSVNGQGSIGYYGSIASSLVFIQPYADTNDNTSVKFRTLTAAASSMGNSNIFQDGTRIDFTVVYITN